MSAVLSSLNMPLQINSTIQKQTQNPLINMKQNAFKQYDYPVQHTQAQSILLNLLSGRQHHLQSAEINHQQNKINLKAKQIQAAAIPYKPKSAQSQINRKFNKNFSKKQKPNSNHNVASPQQINYFSGHSQSSSHLRTKLDNLTQNQESNIFNYPNNNIQYQTDKVHLNQESYTDEFMLQTQKSQKRIGSGQPISSQHQQQLSQTNNFKRRPMSSQLSKPEDQQVSRRDEFSNEREEELKQKTQSKYKRHKEQSKLRQKSKSSQAKNLQRSQNHPFNTLSPGEIYSKQVVLSKRSIDSPFQNNKQLSTIKNTQESLDNDFTQTITQNFELQSMFSPKIHTKDINQLTQSQRFISTQSSNKFHKKQSLQSNIQAFQPRDFFKSPNEDKENIHYNSNQKSKQKSSNLKTKPKILPAQISTDQLFTGDIIQKLKQEVKKQVKKRLEKEMNEQKDKQQKHLASVMPFDMRQKIRQKKLNTIQQSAQQQQTINLKQSLDLQNEVQKQRQEYEDQKFQRLALKKRREDERKENQMCFEILKKSMSNSPLRKKLNMPQSQPNLQNIIRIESVDERDSRANHDILNFDPELDNLDQIMKHKRKQSKGIIDSKTLNQVQANKTQQLSNQLQLVNKQKKGSNSLSPPKKGSTSNSPYISPSKKIKINGQHYEYFPFQKNNYQLKTESTDQAASENRHQSIENYLKEQKSKRLKEQKQKDKQESKKLIKLKSQLTNLQHDYFKGLQEYKEKQRVINNEKNPLEKKRGTSKKRKKSKRASSKKPQLNIAELIQLQKQQALMSPQRQKIEYNLNMQRNSMPVLTKSPQINVQFRQSFQSPEQYQMLRSYEGPVFQNDARSQNSYSPSQHTTDYQLTQTAKDLRIRDRESLISQFTMNTLNTNTGQNTYSQQDLHQFNQLENQFTAIQYQNQVPLSMRVALQKPNLLNNNSQKQLQDVKSLKSVQNSLRQNQIGNKPLLDLKSDQAVKMFSEFARIRKELEKQVKDKKGETQNINLLEAVVGLPMKKKKSSSKKRPKTSNLPLKVGQMPFLKQQYNQQRKQSNATEYPPLQQNLQQQIQNDNNLQYQENNQLLMNYQIMQEQRIQQSKHQIIEKIQQVQEKIQNNFKQRQNNNSQSQPSSNQVSSYQTNTQQISNNISNPKSSQQTIMLSGNNSNVIQEEESKDIEITSYASPQTQRKIDTEQSQSDMNRIPQILSMGEDVSQIIRKTEDDDQNTMPINEDNSIKNNNNNTTMLLKKMYSIEDRVREVSNDKLNEAATYIQKCYRGFIFRKIMKEKLRIDREFRMLRQKYEVKSNPTSNQTLSSLAFSQSKGLQQSNQFKFGTQKTKPWSPFYDQLYDNSNQLSNFALIKLQQQQQQQKLILEQQHQQQILQQQQQHEIFKSQSQESLESYMQTFQNNQNQSEQFYKFDDLGNGGMASVFKSPSIEEQSEPKDSQIQNQMKAVFDYQPTKLQFQDSQINVNLMKESELTTIPVIVRELKESKPLFNNFIREEPRENERQSDRSFMNDDNSQRSLMPIQEESPFISKNTDENIVVYNNQIKQNKINFYGDKQSSIIQENEDSLMKQHADYLDSPLKLNDLSLNKISTNNSPRIKMNLKRMIPPRPQTKVEEANAKRDAIQMRERGNSSVEDRSQSSQSQIYNKKQQQLDISSLINYGEEEKMSKNRSNTRSSKMKQKDNSISNKVTLGEDDMRIKQTTKDLLQKIPSSLSNNFGSVITMDERSPAINIDDLSPSNQHQTYISGSQKQRKDDSVSINNTSIFEKNSFQIFQRDKQVNVFKVENEIEQMIKDLNKALKQKVKIKKQELKDGELSVRTYNKKKGELEKWVEKEKREINLTKKHFKQGCMGFMRLSSLMENFSKEQDRMKDAVSSIRKKGNSGILQQNNSMNITNVNQNSAVRRSHSFDSEMQKQYDEVQQNLFGDNSNKEPSDGYNTVSGRRLSSGLASSFATANVNQPKNEIPQNQSQNNNKDDIQPLYQIDEEHSKLKLFDYNTKYDIDSQNNAPKNEDDSQDEIQLLEINSNKLSDLALSHKNSSPIFDILNKKNSQNENVNDFSGLEDLSPAKGQLNINALEAQAQNNDNLASQISQQKLSFPLSGNSMGESSNNQYQLSDTPLYQQNDDGKLSFPAQIKSIEDIEKQEQIKVDLLVEEILENVLLRDIRERLFPRRALSKLFAQQKPASLQQQVEVRRIDLQVNKDKDQRKSPKGSEQTSQATILGISPDLQDQIKVLDNILEELDNSQNQISQQPKIQIIEDGDRSASSRNSPEAVNDINDPKILDYFPMPSDLEKSPIIDEKEILEPHESPSKKGIETGIKQVNVYMQEIFDRLKVDKTALSSVLENISQPLYKDPLMILAHLQNSIPELPALNSENEDSENPQQPFESAIPFQQSVLSVDLYLDIEKDRRGGLSISQMKDSFHGDDSNSQSFVNEMENIHNKAIFDAVNEAMDGFRPYGLRGPPLPWSKNSKTLTFKFGKEETFDYLLQKVKFRVLDWAHISAGTMPKIFKAKQISQRDRDHLELMREERLARILIQEAEENEPLWTDYEYEETQTKIDVADLILEQMIEELVSIMKNNQKDKEDDGQIIDFNLMIEESEQNKESVVEGYQVKDL
ncbi:iq calmodulin-binding motif family protein [Stylonychia lemnae]|uniref:Iq calmodulin-binding motif family protein n=1 Tax=Stylonychia lemnae TaxID=5949 RepID=A0A078AC05_STYLE|nr:iq calmodulin-binding motif family protein [Stylonychia lemnae]|eukprot:CDW79825.1 iq calmodulin-binding motif family protein [Stylonychia lemnae]